MVYINLMPGLTTSSSGHYKSAFCEHAYALYMHCNFYGCKNYNFRRKEKTGVFLISVLDKTNIVGFSLDFKQ